MARGKKSGSLSKWNSLNPDQNDGSNIDRIFRELEQDIARRQRSQQPQPTKEKPQQPQALAPASSLNGNPQQKHFLTRAFSRAGFVNWVGDLVNFPQLSHPGNMECVISAKQEKDGWEITRHARFLGQARWQKQLVTVPKETDPIIIRNALVTWAVRAGEEIDTVRRVPHELVTGSEITVTGKEWPYLTPVFKNAGAVVKLRYKQYETFFNYHGNTACALLVRPVQEGHRWEVTRHRLSGEILKPEEPHLLPEGIQHSQVLKAVTSWSRAAKGWSKGEFVIPHNKLKELSAMLLVDTRLDSSQGQTAEAPNPPSQ